MLAPEKVGFAIPYGLGKGTNMIAAAWGVFIWEEFQGVPRGTNKLIGFIFLFFLLGLGLIIGSRSG